MDDLSVRFKKKKKKTRPRVTVLKWVELRYLNVNARAQTAGARQET